MHTHTHTHICGGKVYENTHKYIRKYMIMKLKPGNTGVKYITKNEYQRAFVYTAEVNGG